MWSLLLKSDCVRLFCWIFEAFLRLMNLNCSNEISNRDLSAFNAEIVVPEGRKSVRWVVGIRTGINLGSYVWRNPKGREIMSGRRQKYSVIVEENNPTHVKIICMVYDIDFDDMGNYQLEVSTKENPKVTESLDMRLRVLGDRPRVSFVGTNFSSFYQANRYLVY